MHKTPSCPKSVQCTWEAMTDTRGDVDMVSGHGDLATDHTAQEEGRDHACLADSGFR
jgi:hypothetical protein